MEEQPSTSIEINQDDRVRLANDALEVVHMFGRTAEVLIGFQRLIRESEIDGMVDVDAFDISYETFKNIGRILQGRLVDEGDYRTVKLRSDYVYRVVFDPDQQRKSTGKNSIRSLGYIGNSLIQHQKH